MCLKPELENGSYELIMNDNEPDYYMIMTCDEGFTLEGVKNFTCENGSWDRVP